ncbi:PH domain-containing protein [Actinomadura sediminis]|uniref:PH domain-containing protein n=1 Tax=Actinomadura sediminis TaxID=1038904 RepID=A0ABW3EST4_9ACTN
MTIRSTGGRVAAFAWLAFAALNIADLVFGFTGDPEHSPTTYLIAALLLLGCGIAYTVGLRPAIVGDDDALTVRNPLRDTRAPWGAVRSIEGREAVVVRFTGPDGDQLRTRAWVHQTSPRAQAKAEARARKQDARLGAQIKGRTPAKFAAERLNEMRDRQRPKTRSGAPDKAAAARDAEDVRGSVSWSIPAIAALAVPGVAVVVCAILAFVS